MARAHPVGKFHDPFSLAVRPGGIAAPADLAAAETVHRHPVAGSNPVGTAGNDGSRKIDSRDMRIIAHQPAKAVQAQAVLVVDRRIFDRDIDLAIIGELRRFDLMDACGYGIVICLIDN